MTAMQFSDEELTAFLDDELSADKSIELTKLLATDKKLSERLESLSFSIDALKQGADQLLQEAPDYIEPTPVPDTSSSTANRFIPYAAVLLVGLAVGYIASSFSASSKLDGWTTAVAAYQALYIEETLANASQPAAMTEQVLSGFGQAHGVPVQKFTQLPALTFKRAQLLGFKDRPLLQMAFTTASGKPVALCITRVDEVDRTPKSAEYENLPAYDWVKDGKGFILIGDMDATDMRSAVDKISSILG